MKAIRNESSNILVATPWKRRHLQMHRRYCYFKSGTRALRTSHVTISAHTREFAVRAAVKRRNSCAGFFARACVISSLHSALRLYTQVHSVAVTLVFIVCVHYLYFAGTFSCRLFCFVCEYLRVELVSAKISH